MMNDFLNPESHAWTKAWCSCQTGCVINMWEPRTKSPFRQNLRTDKCAVGVLRCESLSPVIVQPIHAHDSPLLSLNTIYSDDECVVLEGCGHFWWNVCFPPGISGVANSYYNRVSLGGVRCHLKKSVPRQSARATLTALGPWAGACIPGTG